MTQIVKSDYTERIKEGYYYRDSKDSFMQIMIICNDFALTFIADTYSIRLPAPAKSIWFEALNKGIMVFRGNVSAYCVGDMKIEKAEKSKWISTLYQFLYRMHLRMKYGIYRKDRRHE